MAQADSSVELNNTMINKLRMSIFPDQELIDHFIQLAVSF